MELPVFSDDVDSTEVEVTFDPHGPMGLMVADTVAGEQPDPLDLLIKLEEYLLEHHGLTFIQAIRKGLIK